MFVDDDVDAFRYRLWLLGEMANGKEIRLVCRTEQDGVMLAPNGEIQTLTIKALNEWDPKVFLFSHRIVELHYEWSPYYFRFVEATEEEILVPSFFSFRETYVVPDAFH